jgi:hypothetical protein
MREFIKYSHAYEVDTQDRPKRNFVIGKDDILNLTIALETGNDVLEILEDQHIFR